MSIPRLPRLLVAGLAAGAVLAPAANAAPKAPVVPADIRVEAGHKVFLDGHAVGVQIYSCNATATGHAWGLVAPRADLYDDKGRLIIKHFGGPTWQSVKDGSSVVAARVNGVTVNATAIPWLLLKAVSWTEGSKGPHRLADTTFIQRIATTGGLAPAAAACNAATVGIVEEIPYTADYYFWKKHGHG